MAPANIFGTHNYLVRERSVFDIFSTVVSSTLVLEGLVVSCMLGLGMFLSINKFHFLY